MAGNQRGGGKKQYDFGYFERMNQKQAEPKAPPPPRTSPGNSAAQRSAAAKRSRDAAAARQEGRRPPQQRPPAGGKGPPNGRAQLNKKKSQTKVPPRPKKPPKPPKPPKPKKPKPSLSPEQIRKRRRRNRILFTLCLILAVVIAGIILSLTVLFHVTDITVTGESRYSRDEIVQASQLVTGGNLFTTNTGGAAENIESQLPYVGTVKVSRKLPGTLEIQIKDIVVAGAVQYDGGYLVVGSNGKALEKVATLPENCPAIVGVTLSQAEIGQLVEYADPEQTKLIETMALAAEENELDRITQIDITDPYNVKMVYDGRITMKFGLPTDLDYKIRFAQSALDSEISATARGFLDLSLARELSRVFFEENYTAPPVSSTPDPSSQASSAVSSPASSAPQSTPAA